MNIVQMCDRILTLWYTVEKIVDVNNEGEAYMMDKLEAESWRLVSPHNNNNVSGKIDN